MHLYSINKGLTHKKEIGLASTWEIFHNIKKKHLAISCGNLSLRILKIKTFETLCNEPFAQKPNLRTQQIQKLLPAHWHFKKP